MRMVSEGWVNVTTGFFRRRTTAHYFRNGVSSCFDLIAPSSDTKLDFIDDDGTLNKCNLCLVSLKVMEEEEKERQREEAEKE